MFKKEMHVEKVADLYQGEIYLINGKQYKVAVISNPSMYDFLLKEVNGNNNVWADRVYKKRDENGNAIGMYYRLVTNKQDPTSGRFIESVSQLTQFNRVK